MTHKRILLVYVIDSDKFNIWDFRYGTLEHQNDFNFIRLNNKILKYIFLVHFKNKLIFPLAGIRFIC